ncbi:MAG TPA: glutamate--cysteine ligase [Rhodospirillales bacterium]|nr:glutamate--cysteine ligase [Rhodospirillales bacterium]
MKNAIQNTEVSTKDQLVEFLEDGCKPPEDWRIGTEHEKFAFDPETFRTLAYEGKSGVREILERMCRFGWEPVLENGKPIGLKKPDNSSISLEPGGQIELSGAPLETIHQTCGELTNHLEQVKEVAGELDVGFLGLGYIPKWTLKDINWMPKDRYKIMREYMLKKGNLGHHMMLATCTVQVNLDFSSESHMVRMFRTALALQPVATALWANSPFREGSKNGYLSFRSHIWNDTDPDRTGILPFVFEDGFGFERYVDYMLDVPMYFVYRDGQYIDVSGESFRDFLKGKLGALSGKKPTLKDWEDHMTTAFPEVRLKRFLEMRGADGGPWENLCALPAFWVGLLYDNQALADAENYVSDWSFDELSQLRNEVPKTALKTRFRNNSVQDIALDILEISKAGLHRRARVDSAGNDETSFLNPLFKIAVSGNSPADNLLAAFDGSWGGSIDPVFSEQSY